MPFQFPVVYPILDASFIRSPIVLPDRLAFLKRLGSSLADAGVTLLEYRNKTGTDAELMADAQVLRVAMPAGKVKLIIDDRCDLVDAMEFDGVHVDAGDISAVEARKLLGSDRIVGTFGGSGNLLTGILQEPVDYLAIGPVFPTTTKQTSKAPIGIEGVRHLRQQAGRDAAVLVAAAGITLETAAAVLEAGANTLAVAAAIFRAPDPGEEFRRWMQTLAG